MPEAPSGNDEHIDAELTRISSSWSDQAAEMGVKGSPPEVESDLTQAQIDEEVRRSPVPDAIGIRENGELDPAAYPTKPTHEVASSQQMGEVAEARKAVLIATRNGDDEARTVAQARIQERLGTDEVLEPSAVDPKTGKPKPGHYTSDRDAREEFVLRALNIDPYSGPDYAAHTVQDLVKTAEASGNPDLVRSAQERVERTAAANGLAYDMLHDPAMVKQVLAHRKVEGYDPVVVNMAAQGYSELKRASKTKDPEKADRYFQTAQRLMAHSGGIGAVALRGLDKNPRVTNPQELVWKMRHGVARRLGRRP